jgi:2-polyprenyl-3-methyl-5-hydroxy-6-metoxy-1,4-benzoquinol methylase
MKNANSMQHWEHVYATKKPTEVSWYRQHLDTSLRLIEKANPDRSARIIDVGGGESTLVDDLLTLGCRDVTVLDLSETAIQVAKERLGPGAGRVKWLHGDVTNYALEPNTFDVWHDRAVFHFLTRGSDRLAYVRQVARSVRLGGHVIVATFGPEGPTQCSGLDVVRYDPERLHDTFGARFQLLEHLTESHQTPAGKTQQFIYCYCKLTPGAPESPRTEMIQ